MSFDRAHLNPNHDTHVPIKVAVPADDDWSGAGRPVLPTPSLWQEGVKVVNKITGREAVVRKVDHYTNQFRAYYPDTGENDGRSSWQHCKDWTVAVTLSPAEQEKQLAREALQAEIAKLDPEELAAVSVLVDDPDARKALAKLEAMRKLGIIKSAPVAQAALEQARSPRESPREQQARPREVQAHLAAQGALEGVGASLHPDAESSYAPVAPKEAPKETKDAWGHLPSHASHSPKTRK